MLFRSTFLQFDMIGNATLTGITLETVVDATMEYVKENATYWDKIKDITSSTGKVRADMLEGLIDLTLNAFANESGTITQENGIMTWLNGTTVENSTQAVQIVGGAIRIANSKLPNGEWNWTTAISGAGINAATIIAETFAALNITGVTITAGTITGGTINGVTMKGGEAYFGDVEKGNYMVATQSGDIKGYASGVNTVNLTKNSSGKLALRDPFTGGKIELLPFYDYAYNDGSAGAGGMTHITGPAISISGGKLLIQGSVVVTGRIEQLNH